MSLLLLRLLLLTALNFDLKGHILITYGSINPNMYKFVYSETTGCYGNVPVLSRGTFYTYGVSANKNKTFIIKWRHEESWIYLLFEILVRLILLFSASTIIASWTDCWKYFVLFLPLKGSQEFAFRRVQHCQFIWFFWSEILIDQLKIYCIIYGRKIYNKLRKLERIVRDVSKAE